MLYRSVFVALFLALTSSAFAHGTGLHVLGTVVAIDEKHLQVKTQKGTTVDVQINKQTRFKEKDHPKSTNLPTVGDRVVVEAVKDEKNEKTLTATEVHFSSIKKPAPPAPALTQQPPAATPAP